MPYSNYTKIFDLLTELDHGDGPRELFAWAEEVREKEIESFAIWRPGPEPDAPPIKTYCSAKSIRRLIRFVAELGLIKIGEGKECRLTSTGRNALQGDNYGRAMSTHMAMYLKNQAGITYSDLKDTISAIQRSGVPFFDTIYERVSDEQELQIGEGRFRMALYLLERCGMLTSLTRKVYFSPEAEAWSG